MSYSRKCINIVNEEFEAKRVKSESNRQARLNEAYSALPELEAIDKELAKTGVNAMACAMGGKEGQWWQPVFHLSQPNISKWGHCPVKVQQS